MSPQDFLLLLHRIQFGLSAGFHYIFVPLSLGLLLCLNVLQTRYWMTRNVAFQSAARYWLRYFLLTWVIGAITGYALRYQLRDQWGMFGEAAAPVLNRMLEIEGTIGPVMLLAVLMLAIGRRWFNVFVFTTLGWLLLALMVIQANTILSVNAWMQHPVGVSFLVDGWRLNDLSQVFLSETAINKTCHTLAAAMMTGSSFVLAVSAAGLVKQRDSRPLAVSVIVAAWVGLVSTLFLALSGHASVSTVARVQPMKFASFEGHWRSEPGLAPMILFAVPEDARHENAYEVHIPYLMSWLVGQAVSPPGIDDLTAEAQVQAAHALSNPELPDARPWLMLANKLGSQLGDAWAELPDSRKASDIANAARPPVRPLFLAFRVMVASGVVMGLLSCWVFRARKVLASGQHRVLMILVRLALPLPWVATASGWAVAEIGRQPWTVYQRFTTAHSLQSESLESATLTFVLLLLSALATFALSVRIGRSIQRAGPDCERWILTLPWVGWLQYKTRQLMLSRLAGHS